LNQLASREYRCACLRLPLRARFEQQTRTAQSWAAPRREKPSVGNGKQIVGGTQLAGGVAFERQPRIVMRHAVAVVGLHGSSAAAHFHFDANGVRLASSGFRAALSPPMRAARQLRRRDFIRHRFRAICVCGSGWCSLGGRDFSPGVRAEHSLGLALKPADHTCLVSIEGELANEKKRPVLRSLDELSSDRVHSNVFCLGLPVVGISD